MRLPLKIGAWLLLGLLFQACSAKEEGSSSTPPSSPEEVLKAYQALVDQNKFEQAKRLSTAANQDWLTELGSILEGEQPDSTLFQTEFLAIHCEGLGDTLRCNCVLEDQYEKYTSDYYLVKANGQWLVDAPKDDVQIEGDILENLPDTLLQELMEEAPGQ